MIHKITKLPEAIVSKIAAGEVVERPTNIVKELIENAIDAGSTAIIVTIIDGGKESIKVVDNGSGIRASELILAFKLHTTSKLHSEDISQILSLGFRGEALASIASVSRIEASSKSDVDSTGKQVIMEGGRIMSESDHFQSTGTSITVSSLFFNTPARRKFLKSANTERKRISDLIINYCLMYPQIHFKLDEELKNGKLVSRVESPSRNSMEPAIYDVLGSEIARELIYFTSKIGIWDLEGYISTPMINRSDRSLQFINVNGRPIRHKALQSTIEESYKSQLLRNTHPIIILKINGPPNHVDFNIHPQKSEIRFRVSDPLIEQIPELILSTLSSKSQLPEIQKQKLDRISRRNLKKSGITPIQTTQSSDRRNITSKRHKSLLAEERKSTTVQKSLFDEIIIEPNQDKISVLGHIMNKFGVVLFKNEIWLVDVHAADERVKFEMYGKSSARDVSTQTLLIPMTVSLISSEKQIILDHLMLFQKFGLKISNGGGNKILVHSVPVFYDQEITDKSIIELISDFISYLSLEDSDYGSVETPLNRIEYGMISRLACHGSVRSGYPVSNLKIKEIVIQLLDCEYPWTCAHGRPTVLRLSKTELESMFKR